MQLAFEAGHKHHPAATFLRSEVHRAIVVDEINAAQEIVQLNSCVSYQLDKQVATARVLVHPEDYASRALHLSVLTSLGAALIGVRVGDTMPFMCTEGNLHLITPLSVRHQDRLVGRLADKLSEENTAACCHPRTGISGADGSPQSRTLH
jgi:regulator of nucleoside diphosphate kinase